MPRQIKNAHTKPQILKTSTAERLLEAAIEEFNRVGFGGTNTNQIARLAGYAPQTFYRWFVDKTAIFLAAYRKWEDEEMGVVVTTGNGKQAAQKIAKLIVSHHRAHLGFRRSLRQLAYENEEVRSARILSRKRQVKKISEWMNGGTESYEAITLTLLQIERISDAIAEGEIQGLGVTTEKSLDCLTKLIQSIGRS